MKPRACVVVASEMTLRAFLAPQLAAMSQTFDLTVVVNTTHAALLQELGIMGRLQPLAIARSVAPWMDLKAVWRLQRFLRAGGFDLVHSMTPKAGVIAMTAAWLARTPVRVHTFTGQVWATRRGLTRAALKYLDKVMAHAATLTLADSPSQREFLITQSVVPADKVALLCRGSVSGVDAGRFRPQPTRREHLRERLEIPPHDLLLLFVGRLNRDKGVLDLAQAFAALADERPDVRLLVVGPDEQEMRPAMRALCRRHVSRLQFLDFVNAPEDVMAASDVLCLPSYREGFGSVVIEAAAVGVPAVASRIYGVVDAVDDGRTGLLHEPGDIGALKEQLRRIVGDADLRRALGEAARVRATQEFSQERLTAAVLDLYARLIDGRPAADDVTLGSPGRQRPAVSCGSGGGVLQVTGNDWYRRVGKRLFDVVGAGSAIALLLPLAAAVAVLVRVSLGTPVLFRQRRAGLHGASFVLVKFRSMADRHDEAGKCLPDAERLTPVGQWLRAFSLDEIPEFWNVLTGHMSLVGPRPLLMEYLPRYSEQQARRHAVRPGLTGLAQVNGRNALTWPQRLALDVRYVESCSLAQDVEILARTVWQVLTRRGINQPGRATVDYFQGDAPGHTVATEGPL